MFPDVSLNSVDKHVHIFHLVRIPSHLIDRIKLTFIKGKFSRNNFVKRRKKNSLEKLEKFQHVTSPFDGAKKAMRKT